MKLSVLLLAPLGACALFPLGEADCKAADWRGRGYEHGVRGQPRQDLRLAPECRERFGIEVSESEYLAGWADGHNEWDRLMGAAMHRMR
jgi:hypothetical protein